MIKDDYAQSVLLPFLDGTENLLRRALRTLDSTADCQVRPAPDLGFPHDVVRLAGGFPTGCLVEWACDVPFVPVDTTVNIDTSSVFILDGNASDFLQPSDFERLRRKMEDEGSYVFNFHKGNHFISAGFWVDKSVPVLVIHSNEKEFKYQYNGLMPHRGNWYMDRCKQVTDGERRIRYIDGADAELFVRIAKMLEPFNLVRHAFVATELLSGRAGIVEQMDWHHYYMPTEQSVAIGCFLGDISQAYPVFSRPGRNIDFFRPQAGGANAVTSLNGGWPDGTMLIPHGWGKGCKPGSRFEIDLRDERFRLEDETYSIDTLVSMGRSAHLDLRMFDSDPTSSNSFYAAISDACPGRVESSIVQEVSYTSGGFIDHRNDMAA